MALYIYKLATLTNKLNILSLHIISYCYSNWKTESWLIKPDEMYPQPFIVGLFKVMIINLHVENLLV